MNVWGGIKPDTDQNIHEPPCVLRGIALCVLSGVEPDTFQNIIWLEMQFRFEQCQPTPPKIFLTVIACKRIKRSNIF